MEWLLLRPVFWFTRSFFVDIFEMTDRNRDLKINGNNLNNLTSLRSTDISDLASLIGSIDLSTPIRPANINNFTRPRLFSMVICIILQILSRSQFDVLNITIFNSRILHSICQRTMNPQSEDLELLLSEAFCNQIRHWRVVKVPFHRRMKLILRWSRTVEVSV